ncbi:MAG: hypothetical protein PIR53_02710 [Nocardioides alkalitolerans]
MATDAAPVDRYLLGRETGLAGFPDVAVRQLAGIPMTDEQCLIAADYLDGVVQGTIAAAPMTDSQTAFAIGVREGLLERVANREG